MPTPQSTLTRASAPASSLALIHRPSCRRGGCDKPSAESTLGFCLPHLVGYYARLSLFQALAVHVVDQHPELFIGMTDRERESMAHSLVGHAATGLRRAPSVEVALREMIATIIKDGGEPDLPPFAVRLDILSSRFAPRPAR